MIQDIETESIKILTPGAITAPNSRFVEIFRFKRGDDLPSNLYVRKVIRKATVKDIPFSPEQRSELVVARKLEKFMTANTVDVHIITAVAYSLRQEEIQGRMCDVLELVFPLRRTGENLADRWRSTALQSEALRTLKNCPLSTPELRRLLGDISLALDTFHYHFQMAHNDCYEYNLVFGNDEYYLRVLPR